MGWGSFTTGDWALLLQIARREGVAPLLYKVFLSEGIPSAAPIEDLKAAYYANVARNMRLFHELERVLDTLVEQGIPVVVLKGAALAKSLYEDPGLRVMSDLDLLVPKERLFDSVTAAEALGYTTEPQWRYPEIRRGQRMLTFFEANLDGGADGQTHLELHWGLVASEASFYRPRMEWFWQQVTTGEPGLKSGTWVLNPTANLLFLCAHLALKHFLYKHGDDCTNLRWYYDLHLLINKHREQIDWDEVLRCGQEFHWTFGLQEALKGTQTLFETQIPARFMERLSKLHDPVAERLQKRVQNRKKTRTNTSLDDYALMSPRPRLWLLTALIVPSKTYLIDRYHPKPQILWPFCYPYRWMVISFDLVKTLFTAH